MPVEFLGIAGTNPASEVTPRTGGPLDLEYTFSARGYDIYDDAIDFGRYVIPLVRSEVAHREQVTRKDLAS
jgi:alkanesulfonate monooxygenase